MRIGYIGNFKVPFTTENDLAWSLDKLGHTLLLMQEDQWTTNDILARSIEEKLDLILYTHTHGWNTPGDFDLTQLWQDLRNRGKKTASFHLDYWKGLAREGDVGKHPFWQTDYVFTADGGSHDWYIKQGIKHYWLKPGVVERDCYYAEPLDEFKHDVIFVGSKRYHPEWPYRSKLVDWLQMTYGDRFAHYGGDGIRVVRGHELNQLYRSAKVVVGDSLCLDFKHSNYWSDRVNETLGRGGFLIHPLIKGMPKFYKDKKHLVYYQFDQFDQLKKLIDYYIANYAERERIRLEGHLHVKKNHTYTQRMQEMLGVINGKS